MSSKVEIDLKDGHALPATKLAGGVRISQKPHKHHSTEKVRSQSESEEGVEEVSTSPKHPNPIISGAKTHGDKDFTTAAVKAFHEKPLKVSNDHMNGGHKPVIQQPKKF